LWVEALCINQTDKEELDSQRALKRRIYGQADTVCIHLGEIGNEWYQGCDLMMKLAFTYQRQQEADADRSLTLDQIWTLYRLPGGHHPAWTEYQKVFKSVRSRRTWILQEVAMAKDVTMSFGRFGFPWTLFLQSCRFLTESRLLPPTTTSNFAPVDFGNEIPSSVMMQEPDLDMPANAFPFYLCQHCRSFDLTVSSFVVRPHHPSPEAGGHSTTESFTTRPFEQLQESAQQNCRMCCLIQRAVTRAYPVEAAIPHMNCEIRKKDRTDVYQPIKYRILQVLLRIEWPRNGKETPTVELLPVESNEAPGVFPGRHLDPTGINYSLIKDWMQECQRTHGSMCKHSFGSRFKEIAPSLRVIDITNRCLTQLPLGSRYVALSYVWGNCDTTKAFATLQSNVNRLIEPGSFDNVLSSSPSVVSDAFDFVRNIGEKYLWIDRICIVQDDAEEKQEIIRLMNLVYENAFITLFAASSKDANAGLPGVRQNSRGCQQLIDRVVPGLELMVPLDLDTLTTSPWANRAWT
jgi:hypothetical protein